MTLRQELDAAHASVAAIQTALDKERADHKKTRAKLVTADRKLATSEASLARSDEQLRAYRTQKDGESRWQMVDDQGQALRTRKETGRSWALVKTTAPLPTWIPLDVVTLIVEACDDSTKAILSRVSYGFLLVASKSLYTNVVIKSKIELTRLFCRRESSTPRIDSALSLGWIKGLKVVEDRADVDENVPLRFFLSRNAGQRLPLARLVIDVRYHAPFYVQVLIETTNPAFVRMQRSRTVGQSVGHLVMPQLHAVDYAAWKDPIGGWSRLERVETFRLWLTLHKSHWTATTRPRSIFELLPTIGGRSVQIAIFLDPLHSQLVQIPQPVIDKLLDCNFGPLLDRRSLSLTINVTSPGDRLKYLAAWRSMGLSKQFGEAMIQVGAFKLL